MAKVSPLLGRTKFDWRLRLGTLVTEVGRWAIALGEDGTKRASGSMNRGGYRFVYTSRIYGRHRNHSTSISIYGRNKALIYGAKNNALVDVGNIHTGEFLTDYKALYQFLERRIYATFNAAVASEIMSEADTLYDVMVDK